MNRKKLTPKQEEHINLSKYHINYYIDKIKEINLDIDNLNLNEIQSIVIQTEYFLSNFHTLNELLRLKLKFKYDWKPKMYDKAIYVKINKITHSEVFNDDLDLIIAKANLFDKLVDKKIIKFEKKLLEE